MEKSSGKHAGVRDADPIAMSAVLIASLRSAWGFIGAPPPLIAEPPPPEKPREKPEPGKAEKEQ